MAKKRTIEDCKSGRDYCGFVERIAKEKGYLATSRQSGSHKIYSFPNRGTVVIPMHKELKKGTAGSVKRMLSLIGLLILLVAVLAAVYPDMALALGHIILELV